MKCPMCEGGGEVEYVDHLDKYGDAVTNTEPCPCCAYAEQLAREACEEYGRLAPISRGMTYEARVNHAIATARARLERDDNPEREP